MINDSIFEYLSIDRRASHWEDRLYDLTPVQLLEDNGLKMYFKRGDFFAPLGYGGINGDKLRVAIWLMTEHLRNGGSPDIIHGTVVGSPQSPMATAVSRHFGGETITVLGATKPTTAIKHDMVSMSAWFGSKFDIVGSGYNSTIQPRAKQLINESSKKPFYLEYGITTDHKIETNDALRICNFHGVGAHQVKNIPKSVSRLVIPAGSCNSCMSVLLGLALYPQEHVKEIHLIGIGPNRIRWMEERLRLIKSVDPVLFRKLDTFDRVYTDSPELMPGVSEQSGRHTNKLWGKKEKKVEEVEKPSFTVTHYDLHTTNWVRYNDLMPNQFGGVELHPRYEGKVLQYLKEKLPHLISEDSMFWIVGSKPSIEAMKPACPELGEVPESITMIG